MFEIWHDNDFDLAHWLYLNSNLKNERVRLRQIPKTNSPGDLLKHLKSDADLCVLKAIKYETPDIVLIKTDRNGNSSVELVIEFMTHVPQHHHPLQRYTRIYGAAWQGIPSILVIPQKKEKLEKGNKDSYKPTMYKANPLIYHLFIKTSEITGTPTLLMMWPEKNGYLKYDKTHPTAPRIEGDIAELLNLVNKVLRSEELGTLTEAHLLKQKKLSDYSANGNTYKLTTGEVIQSSELVNRFKKFLNEKLKNSLLERKETYLFSPNGLKKEFRTDPYAGMTCAFDVLFCRDNFGNRYRNMVLKATNVPSEGSKSPTLKNGNHDEGKCPFLNASTLAETKKHFLGFCPYTERKQQRIYGEIPDAVIFDDGVVYVPRY